MTIFQKIDYKPFIPRVSQVQGRKIITRSGVLLFDWHWTFATIYKNPTVVIRSFSIAFLSIVKRGVAEIEDSRKLGIIHSAWTAGYYHWITESLPRALILKEFNPKAVPLLPSSKYNNYVNSLNLLGFENVRFFPVNRNVIINDPIVTECPPYGATDPKLLKEVRDKIWSRCNCKFKENQNRIVYVSRRKARGRMVLNEKDVVSLMSEFGADIVCFEDLTFEEQVKLMSCSQLLISIHGAALTNMLFMPINSTVIEMIPKKNGVFDYNKTRNSFKHDPCFIRLAKAMGHSYLPLLCKADNAWYAGTHMSNIIVDTRKLREMIIENNSK